MRHANEFLLNAPKLTVQTPKIFATAKLQTAQNLNLF